MSASWTFVLTDAGGNALAELSTASGRTISFKRNSYAEVSLTLSHEDDATQLLLSALANSGVPRLRGYRQGPDDSSGVLRFRGLLMGLQEVSEETSLLTATFRSPFSVLLGDGDKTGRFLGVTPTVVTSTSAVPTVAANDAAAGTVAWSNPNNALSPVGTFATVDVTGAANSQYLKLTNFGFAIPPTATIVGFQVTFSDDFNVLSGPYGGNLIPFLVKAGTVQPGAPSGFVLLSSGPDGSGGTLETFRDGSSTDLWGGSWLPSDVNNSGFGVAFQLQQTSGHAIVGANRPLLTVFYDFDGVTYSALDAGTIARVLVENANQDSATGLGTDPNLIVATKTRDRLYPIGQNIGQAIIDLTAVLDGFDFYETFVDGAGTTDAYFNVTPALGSVEPNARFEYGPSTLANISHLERTTTPPQNSIFITGGNGLTSIFTDTDSVATYGKWWAHSDFSTIIEQATLDDKARALVRPTPVKTVKFVPELGLENCPKPFDDWNLGDTVTLFASRSALSENTQLRVNGFTIPIDENGNESVSVDDPTSPEEDAVLNASLIAEVLDG